MSRSIMMAALFGLALLFPNAARAERLSAGRSLVVVGIGGHRGQSIGVTPPILSFPGVLYRNQNDEVGGEIAYYRFVSDQWALGIAGGYSANRTRTALAGLAGTEVTDTHSFTVRIGGDRYAFIDDNAAVYFGPGAFITRGRWKSDFEGDSDEGPSATELGLNARIGFYAGLRKGWAIIGRIGQNLSRTSGKNELGEISWWSSTSEGMVGLGFGF